MMVTIHEWLFAHFSSDKALIVSSRLGNSSAIDGAYKVLHATRCWAHTIFIEKSPGLQSGQ
jgi:hypothetical protein